MDELKELSKKVDKILFYMESDPATKQEGLVEKVNRIDSDLENLLNREKIYVAKFSTAAFFGGAIFTGIWSIIKYLFKI
jgi:hypothetical protein